MITPFRIDIPQADLDDLTDRLARTRWPAELPLPGAGSEYGVEIARLRELADYWQHGYDWRAHEARLNELPQFTTGIDGANIHFLHIRSTAGPDALPLLLAHGWPGSIVEFLDVIGPLSEDFHLVIPSMPGFGLSGPTHETGWSAERIAHAYAELMLRLGYDTYGVQGGDWGMGIALLLAAYEPDRVVGVHLNYLPTLPPPGAELDGLPAEDLDRIARTRAYVAAPHGHMVVQSTRPHTLGYALTDSPVGQLAWITEKFDEWTDPALRPVDRDRLLTNVMLYWLTGTAPSSARLYKESFADRTKPKPCPVPLGVAVFPHDLALPARALAERTYGTLTHWTEFERGGHFAAIEAPELLAGDVREFFGKLA